MSLWSAENCTMGGMIMPEVDLPYFKFVSPLIDSGLWARMSSAARTLYPVLLRFSDKNFKYVYPGSRHLLKLTGFKQKSTLRKARKELVDLGLISITEGSGRTNTCYHFRFDVLVANAPQGGQKTTPPGGNSVPLSGSTGATPGASAEPPGYNQIHISINNHVQDEQKEALESRSSRVSEGSEKRKRDFLVRRFGQRNLDLAASECKLAGIDATSENLEKILYRNERTDRVSWEEIEKYLTDKISPASLDQIRDSWMEERDGWIVFTDRLPGHLKALLRRITDRVFFEPPLEDEKMPGNNEKVRRFWNSSGVNI